MKHLLSLSLCASLALCVVAQDRSLPSRRAFQPAPVLMTMTGTQDAAGIAQTPMGNILTLAAGSVDVFQCVSFDGTNLTCNGLFDVQ